MAPPEVEDHAATMHEQHNREHDVQENGDSNVAGVNLDLTVPDTARIMDYWLGGSHHFEVDREAARKIERMTPIAPHWAKIQRQFLGRALRYLWDEVGLRHYVVGGAGLPTCGNAHEVLPEAHVLYMDINPVTVAYGKNILGASSRVRYIQHDARFLDTLKPDDIDPLFHGERRIGIVFVGFSYFYPDEVLTEALHRVHAWAAVGSHLILTSLGEDSVKYAAPSVDAYRRMGFPLFPRSQDATRAILPPWELTEHGVTAASHWGLRDVTEPVPPVYFYGCVARKRA